jgi:hypothetical protein
MIERRMPRNHGYPTTDGTFIAGHEVGRAAGPRRPSLMLVGKSVIPINLDCIHFNFAKRRRLSATLNGFHQAHKIGDS